MRPVDEQETRALIFAAHMPKKIGHSIYFGSGSKGPYKWLSNFAAVEHPRGLLFKGRRFRTAEHAYQSLKVHPEDRHRLECAGDLGHLDALELIGKKCGHWEPKHGPVLAGIAAKLLTKPKWNSKLEQPLRLLPKKEVPLYELASLWREILAAKARASPMFKEVLMRSGRVTLVEFDKGAKRETDAGREPFWTGLVQDGVLYGRNWMGKMMMLLREELSDN